MLSDSDLSRDDIEVWRPIMGYEDRYEISNLGRVKSLSRWSGHKGHQLRRTMVLRGAVDRDGYNRVILSKDGASKNYFIHHLVLAGFGNEQPKGQECRHMDGVTNNNRLYNLAWGTSAQNNQDKIAHGTVAKGEKNGGGGKLTEGKVREILSATGLHRNIALKYGVSQVLISAIKRRVVWKHVTAPINQPLKE